MKRHTITILMDVYDSRIHEGIARFVREREYNLVREMNYGLVHEMTVRRLEVALRAYDGLIVRQRFPYRESNLQPLLRRVRQPMVHLTPLSSGSAKCRVLEDNRGAGALVARHFMERGFKRFAFVAQDISPHQEDRIAGFRDELNRYHFDAAPFILAQARGLSWVQFLQKRLFRMKVPLAVLAVDDLIGASVIRHATDADVAIPEAVAIAAVDNDHLVCDFTQVPLTSVDLNYEQQGWLAAQMLDGMLRGDRRSECAVTVPLGGIVARRSSQILAADDPRVTRALRFMWDRLEQPLRSSDVGDYVKTSRVTLDRLFTEEIGRTVKAELLRARAMRVRELLATSDAPASSLAAKAGFKTPQHMYRVFLQQTGMTTRDYRMRIEADAGLAGSG